MIDSNIPKRPTVLAAAGLAVTVVSSALPTRTALSALAVFVLVLGWSITPAQAHCKKTDGVVHSDCDRGDDNDVPGPATLNFVGGMDYPEPEALPVQVGTDSPKKISFSNEEFVAPLGIMMDFNIDPFDPGCDPDVEGCCVTQALPSGRNDAEEVLLAGGVALLTAMADELNTANITSGSFHATIDKKRGTGALGFQYMSAHDLLQGGLTSIQLTGIFGSPITPVVEVAGDTFRYFGGHVIVRHGTAGAQSIPIIGCTVNLFDPTDPFFEEPDVVLILNR